MKPLLSIIALLTVTVGCSETTRYLTEGGEESNFQLTLADTHDSIRNGVRLILSYNSENSMFEGTVENTTAETLSRVRVEVHLSNGVELGPTTPVDLLPGRNMQITLDAEGQTFDMWSAHAEVGGSGGEGTHAGESSNEHAGSEHS